MVENHAPLLVASFGNTMAGDDAFGELVADRLQAMHLPDVEIAKVGMQPFGLLHRLQEDRQGLVILDASFASAGLHAGELLDVDFFERGDLQLVHDLAFSTHGLSVASELKMAEKLQVLPPRVQLIAATVESVDIGRPPSTAVRRLIEPAAARVASLVRQWQTAIKRCQYA